MNCRQVKEKLSAYLDKALSDDEMALINNHLENCPPCREEYKALERTVLMLSGLEEIVPHASFRRELRHKLEEKTKQRFSLQRFIPNWLKHVRSYHLMPIAAALVIMLVVLTFVGNKNKVGMMRDTMPEQSIDSSETSYQMRSSELAENQAAGKAPLGKGGAAAPVAPDAAPGLDERNGLSITATSSDKLTTQPAVEIERKIIKNADITLQVDDYKATVESIKNKVSALNGYIANERLSGKGPEGIISGLVQVRIPAGHFDDFLADMDTLGKVKGRNIYTQDVTEEFVDVESRLKALRTKEERLLAILSKSGNLSDILAVENELANTRSQLESLQGRLRYLNNRTEFSAVSINIQQTAASSQQISAGGLKDVLSKTKEAFIQAVNNILLGAGRLIVFFGSALPYLVLLAIGGILAWWYLLNKNKKKQ